VLSLDPEGNQPFFHLERPGVANPACGVLKVSTVRRNGSIWRIISPVRELGH